MSEQLPKEKSDTPRTDECRVGQFGGYVPVDLAQQLERELNEAKRYNETLERSNRRLRQKAKRS